MIGAGFWGKSHKPPVRERLPAECLHSQEPDTIATRLRQDRRALRHARSVAEYFEFCAGTDEPGSIAHVRACDLAAEWATRAERIKKSIAELEAERARMLRDERRNNAAEMSETEGNDL